MTAPFIHSERAALFADEPQDDNATTVVTRKDRINRELLEMLQRPAKGPISIQGIGLYTHAVVSEPSGTSNDKPKFMPISRPKMISQDETGAEPLLSEDVRRVWYELRDAVHEEEKHVGQAQMSMEQLKERYGALDVPEVSTPIAQSAHGPSQLQQAMEQLKRLKQATELSRNAAMGGANADGTTNTNTAPRGNEYNEARDPRKR